MLTFLADLFVPMLATLAALVLVFIGHRLLRFLGRRSTLARDLVSRAYRPAQVAAALLAWWLTLWLLADEPWHEPVLHGLLLGLIAAGGWLAVALLNVLTDTALRRLRLEGRDPLVARRIRTRLKVAHRVTLAVVSTVAGGIMLITFESVRTVGVSLLASAGLVGIVAALAAQSMLSNFFAGLQVAFGDSLRLDDVVVVEGEWGWIEEITLRHVVLKIWDERRLILPTSYFTTTPFENWTKSERQLLGTVELDVDWSVPFDEMRAELRRVLSNTPLWDGRECGLQVIDGTGNAVRVRALVSARDSSAQWQLRCLVREQLIGWLQRVHPTALPRLRTDVAATAVPEGSAVPGAGAILRQPGGAGADGARPDQRSVR
ncbi:mechanosensitive ion channel [Natronosporangium hydrolyticum]|uniref:Mechanosensitive ion channel n=1 Tax=Natronosporangium hydrolyticum TaxID=2811111 RepID=A0A895YI84_9ACTN|nr:mechanosensitive ion channel domain-containing protein [Natronosporangium hydrolyticum]QSB15762.1 mechanosensitive ion channel [Natronosporangium hydrolyticum]